MWSPGVRRGCEHSPMEPVKEVIKGVFSQLDGRFKAADGITGVATGIPSLDDAGGLIASDLVVLAGHPGVGKTALAICTALHAATTGVDVLYVALSETHEQIVERALLAGTPVANTALRRGMLTRDDMTVLTLSACHLAQLPLHIENAVDLTARRLRELVREWRATAQSSNALVIVDYVQLLNPEPDQSPRSRDEQVAAAVRTLQSTAKESSSSILLVSQVNRGAAKRTDPRPQLADLRESGALEAAATAVVFIHAPDDPTDDGHHEVIVAKHRRRSAPHVDEFLFAASTGTFLPVGPEH